MTEGELLFVDTQGLEWMWILSKLVPYLHFYSGFGPDIICTK